MHGQALERERLREINKQRWPTESNDGGAHDLSEQSMPVRLHEASMSMADIDMTQRAVFSRNHSSSRSAKQCSRYAIFRRVCIFFLLSTSLASLVTYLLRDRIDIGIGFGTLDLDTPLEWLQVRAL